MRTGHLPQTLCVLCIALFLSHEATAQARSGGRVQASIVTQERSARPGGELLVGIVLEMQRGWKVQAGKGSGEEVPPYLPTEVKLTVPYGWTAGAPMWPAAKRFTMSGEELAGYDDTIVVVVPVQVPASEKPGQQLVQATIRFQACDAAICEMPRNIQVVGDVFVGDAGSTPEPDREIMDRFSQTLQRARGGGPAAAPPAMQPGGAAAPAAMSIQEGNSREQSWLVTYWYLWAIVLVVVIACGVVLWRVLR